MHRESVSGSQGDSEISDSNKALSSDLPLSCALALVTGRSPTARAPASLGLRSGHASLAPHLSLLLLKLPFLCPKKQGEMTLHPCSLGLPFPGGDCEYSKVLLSSKTEGNWKGLG